MGSVPARLAAVEDRLQQLEDAIARLLELGQVGADWIHRHPEAAPEAFKEQE